MTLRLHPPTNINYSAQIMRGSSVMNIPTKKVSIWLLHNIKYLEESSRLSESTRRIGNVIAQNSPSGKFYVQLRNKLGWWPSEGHTHGNSIIKTAQVQGRFTQRCYYKGATSVTTKENSLNLSPTPGLTPQRLNYVKVSSLSPSTVSPSSMLLNSR